MSLKSNVSVEVVGQCIAFANCLAATLHKEERIELKYAANGCTTAVECLALGECRAKVVCTGEEASSRTLHVSRVLYNKAQPVMSVTETALDEFEARMLEVCPRLKEMEPSHLRAVADSILDENFTPHAENFLVKSEGNPEAALLLFSSFDPEKDVITCCGGLLQPLAISDEAAVAALRQSLLLTTLTPRKSETIRAALSNSSTSGNLTETLLTLLSNDREGAAATCAKTRQLVLRDGPENPSEPALQISLSMLFQTGLTPKLELDPSTAEKTLVDYFCRCSKNNLLLHLKGLSRELRLQLRESSVDNVCEISCDMCKRVHRLEGQDWVELLERP
jgi:hypothetical protein